MSVLDRTNFSRLLLWYDIIPLERERIVRVGDVAGREFLGDAQHLLEPLHLEAWRGQEILRQAIVAARRHVDVLQVAGLVIIEDFFDEKLGCSSEFIFFMVGGGLLAVKMIWEVLR